MSAAEQGRDDAEPPSSRFSNKTTIAFSIDATVDTSSIPSSENITTWIEHTIQSVCSADEVAKHFELSVSVVDERSIQALNLEYRSKNKPTNVLSFPSGMPLMASDAGELNFQPLGDVVVCQSVIVKEAKAQHKSVEHHFAHMIVHSVLHLLGYDHEAEHDANAMEATEIALLAQLSIPNPYQPSFENQ